MGTKKLEMMAGAILISFFALVSGCNKSSGTSPDNPPVAGSGADYFPLSGNQTLSGKVTYQAVAFDSSGKVTGSYAITGQDVKGYVGTSVPAGDMQGYPLYGYSQDGKTLMPSAVVAAEQNQSVVLFEQPGQNIVMLPKDLSVGTEWVANPFSPPDQQLTLKITGSKSSYANSAGSTYSDVIVVNASYLDSAVTPSDYRYDGTDYWYSYRDTSYSRIDASLDMYFAKGVGLVDVKVSKYDMVSIASWIDSSYNSYLNPPLQVTSGKNYARTVLSGSLGRTDSPGASVAQSRDDAPANAPIVVRTPKKMRLIDLLFPGLKSQAVNPGPKR